MVRADVSDQLRRAGLRVTAPRQPVLQWPVDHPLATAGQIRAGVPGHIDCAVRPRPRVGRGP